jgi:6-phosphogluconolactonase (cycloisomerase 2 family)
MVDMGLKHLILPVMGAMASCLAACGGGGGSASPAAPTFSVEGTVTGLLSGTSVVLQNNAANSTPVSVNASFSFSTALASGAKYAVTVLTQPIGETCSVANASGIVASANVSIAVTCIPNSYSIGGNVSGLLPGVFVVLANTNGGAVGVSANGAFTFNSAISAGSAYSVTVSTQPSGESCTVENGSGTVVGASITSVGVICSALSYTISANVFGLPANSVLVLQNNGGDNLPISGGGTFAFKTPIASQSTYAVTVLTQPVGQTCVVNSGIGPVAATNVIVTVLCPWHVAYVPDFQDNAVLGYYIDPTSGALMSLPGNKIGGSTCLSGPTTVAATPNNKFLYVANQTGSGSVCGYAIDHFTGELTPVVGSPFVAGAAPLTVVVDATGQFLYVANIGIPLANGTTDPTKPSSISAYTIDQATGVLTPVTGSPYVTSTSPSPIVADPKGSFLFASNGTYTINASTGALSYTGSANGMGCLNSVTGQQNCAAAVRPDGDFLYVGATAFGIASGTGNFSPVSGGAASVQATSVAITPNGQFLYLGGIDAYSIDTTTGLTSTIAGSPYIPPFSGIGSVTIAIDPSGQYLYASNFALAAIAGYTINPSTGALTGVAGSPFSTFRTMGVFGSGGYSIAIVPLL